MINPEKYFAIKEEILTTPDKNIYSCNIAADLPYFDGHFPGFPILPAVALIDLAREILKKILHNENLQIAKLKTAKFRKNIVPGDTLFIEVKYIDDANWELYFKSDEAKVSTIKLTLRH